MRALALELLQRRAQVARRGTQLRHVPLIVRSSKNVLLQVCSKNFIKGRSHALGQRMEQFDVSHPGRNVRLCNPSRE